ncbi:MAG: AAC(3) family N-acetyltransferase [Halobacteriovoraceae bacterium]|nr:AAC(3) family N-acetyltransferase [Halobacteriovoraceae bacterium]
MPQLDIIKHSYKPQTAESLKKGFKKIGLKAGMNLIVHSSLSSIGWVCGGAQSFIKALMDIITWNGTLIMPTQSPSLSDPSDWISPSIPKEWWNEIRSNMPVFDSKITPTEFMGIVPEIFRSFPNVERSYHPTHSFGIWGEKGRAWSLNHPLEESLSEFSPLGHLYANEGHILLIGVNHDSNTSLHLSETKIYNFPKKICGSPILKQGKRVWEKYYDYEYDSSDFNQIGDAFEKDFSIKTHLIGNARAKLIPMKKIVDFGEDWILENRNLHQI